MTFEHDRALAQRGANLLLAERLALEIFVGQMIVQLGRLLLQDVPPLLVALFFLGGMRVSSIARSANAL